MDIRPDLDTVFHTLQNERRRKVLCYLDERPTATTVTIGTLAESLADRDSYGQVRSVERSREYVALVQNHCPQLETVGAIDYDERAKTVGRGEQFDRFVAVLAAASDELDHIDSAHPFP